MIVSNPREGKGFQFPNLKCDICQNVSSYYILIEPYHFCKSCLTNFIDEIDKEIIKDIQMPVYSN